ncbi:MAG TPA: hypothetical protein VFJ82_13210 [Longimicrobium sp.]|nr:hypothetical protein [Longimicrobium sp.]
MRKVKLETNELRVESFPTGALDRSGPGTVEGRAAATRASACASACATCANCSSYPYVCFCTENGCF